MFKITYPSEQSWVSAKQIMLHKVFAMIFERMDFKLLVSAMQNFTWYFFTKMKCHWAKANSWNDGCNALLSIGCTSDIK